MTLKEVMGALEAAGSDATVSTYRRHGITGKAFGVKYADLYKLQKRIGVDQKLAEQLWKSGNHDARMLATMIADAASMTVAMIDAWGKTIENELGVHAVCSVAAKSPHALACLKKWQASKNEWVAAAGWHLIAAMIRDGRGGELEPFEPRLKSIERSIHGERNRVKHSMNGALISMGSADAATAKAAMATAKRIGKVAVDHGDTACKTPDAAQYIEKIVARKKKAGSKKKTSTKKKTVAKKTRKKAMVRA